MDDRDFRLGLAKAHKAFNQGKLLKAQEILMELPQGSPKVRHNIAAVQYLLDIVDAQTVIATLEEDLHPAYRSKAGAIWKMYSVPSVNGNVSAKAEHNGSREVIEGMNTSDSCNGRIPEFALLYEGHETALYNLAAILARSGHPYDATVLLRRLLRIGESLDKAVLGRIVCLFHALTSSSVINRRTTSEADEASDMMLENNTLTLIMTEDEGSEASSSATNSKGKENVKENIFQLFSYISDSNVLVDAIKDIRQPMEKAMALNNLGAFAIKDKKPYVATLCFQKAEELIIDSAPRGYPIPNSSFSFKLSSASAYANQYPAYTGYAAATPPTCISSKIDPDMMENIRQKQRLLLLPIRYNAGLCAILQEEYFTAVEHLLSIQGYMRSSPIFWVRLAEAALGELQKQKREVQQIEYMERQTTFSQLIHRGYMYENFDFLLLPNAKLLPGASQELWTSLPFCPLSASLPHTLVPPAHLPQKAVIGGYNEKRSNGMNSSLHRSLQNAFAALESGLPGCRRKRWKKKKTPSPGYGPANESPGGIFPLPRNSISPDNQKPGVRAPVKSEVLGEILPDGGGESNGKMWSENDEEDEEVEEEDDLPEIDKDDVKRDASIMEELAAVALQNALAMIIPCGFSFSNIRTTFPAYEVLLSYTMLYWACLELHRENYAAVEVIGQALLEWNEASPSSPTSNGTSRNQASGGSRLPPNVHATLLCYLVEALVHLNDPEKAMKVLRSCQPSSLITGSYNPRFSLNGNASGGGSEGGKTNGMANSGSGHNNNISSNAADSKNRSGSITSSIHVDHGPDVAQRSRVEVLMLHVASTQILSGAWAQASSTMDSLISRMFDSAPEGATEFQPEADAYFVYQLLCIFLELGQGKQAQAAELLQKLRWSI